MLEVAKLTIGKIHLKNPSTDFIQKRLCGFVGKPTTGLFGYEFDGVKSRHMGHMLEEMKEISLNGTKKAADKYISRHLKSLPGDDSRLNNLESIRMMMKWHMRKESEKLTKLFGLEKIETSLVKKLHLEWLYED